MQGARALRVEELAARRLGDVRERGRVGRHGDRVEAAELAPEDASGRAERDGVDGDLRDPRALSSLERFERAARLVPVGEEENRGEALRVRRLGVAERGHGRVHDRRRLVRAAGDRLLGEVDRHCERVPDRRPPERGKAADALERLAEERDVVLERILRRCRPIEDFSAAGPSRRSIGRLPIGAKRKLTGACRILALTFPAEPTD